jgi:hypothetical protein
MAVDALDAEEVTNSNVVAQIRVSPGFKDDSRGAGVHRSAGSRGYIEASVKFDREETLRIRLMPEKEPRGDPAAYGPCIGRKRYE